MSVRIRTWRTSQGETRTAWVVTYTDQAGSRRSATFEKKKDAETYEAQAQTEVRAGIHTAVGASITVAEAAETWLDWGALECRERTNPETHRRHVNVSID